MILNLPKGCGVVFGIDKAQFSYISPLITTKSPDAVKLPVIDHLPEIKKEKMKNKSKASIMQPSTLKNLDSTHARRIALYS